MKLTVGEAVITSVYEQVLDSLPIVVPEATPEALATIDWLKPPYVDDAHSPLGIVQAFVIEIGGKVVVLDGCVGDDKDLPVDPGWSHQKTGFLGRFEEAGFDPARVDLVLSTHLHLDHVGWDTSWDGSAWVPTFPNARHVLARAEVEYWRGEHDTPEELPEDQESMEFLLALFRQTQARVWDESVQPVIDAGLVDVVDTPLEVLPGITLIPTPGHTPGHISVHVRSGDADAFIGGDAFHHPSQIARPEWSSPLDIDAAEGVTSRRAVLKELGDSSTIFVGSHFSSPSHGRIVSDGSGGHRFEPGTDD